MNSAKPSRASRPSRPSGALAASRVRVCAVVALVMWQAVSPRAYAFGGLFAAQSEPLAETGAAVLFIDHADSTLTAVVQLKYTGSAEKFAWIMPVPGAAPARVRVSSSTVFQRLDAATSPQYWLEIAGGELCSKEAAAGVVSEATSPPDEPTDLPNLSDPGVLVVDQGSVDPYDYVTIAVDAAESDPAQAATEWLTRQGYDLSEQNSRLLASYLRDGFHLLAFKLTQGKDTTAIRPVAVTYESALPALPIRLATLTAQASLGLQVWIVGPAQAVPANYKSLVLNDALVDWLSGAKFLTGTLPAGGVGPSGPHIDKPRNYDALISAAAAEAGGRGFVTELGQPANLYREQVWSPLDADDYASLARKDYADGVAALLAASARYGDWDGFREAVQGATELPADVALADFAADPGGYRDRVHVDTRKFFELLDQKVITPVSDIAAMLYDGPYLTRLYTTLSADEMTVDPTFDYNADLAQVSNIHLAKQILECSAPPDADSGPWRVELPQGGVVVSEGGRDWPMAQGSLPANLKVVMLGAHGSGAVLADNSRDIGSTLLSLSGVVGDDKLLPRPQVGVTIGGAQRVVYAAADPTSSTAKPADTGACSVTRAGRATRTFPLGCLPLAAALLALGRRRRIHRALAMLLALAACDASDAASPQASASPVTDTDGLPGAMTPSQLQDPETCKGCHPTHYREWSSSMHAYAARDPVFLAMNRRGQRETGGQLGEFCINCHAPMAVADKRSRDGLNLEQLPDLTRGVSCYFCHNVTHVADDHNGKLELAHDDTMRGPIHDPRQPSVHRAEFSDLFDESSSSSSAMCGGCHDIVTPNGVHLERTFQEFRSGLFSKSATGEPPAFASCLGCHMPGQDGVAAVVPEAVPARTVHEHLWPGIDLPLIDFPHRDALQSAVTDCQLGGLSVSYFKLEVTPPDLFTFQLETNAGHNQPSGAAQDRRMWLEFMAYDDDGQLLADASSGNIADGELEEKPAGAPGHDPNLLMFGDHIYDAQGKQVHMFWEAAFSQAHPRGYESNLLPVATTTYIEGRHSVIKQYRASGPNGLPARVTARLRVRPIGLDVLQDLVASGDLDPALVPEMQTLDFGAQLEWTRESGVMKSVYVDQAGSDCSTYRCLLDPSSSYCR